MKQMHIDGSSVLQNVAYIFSSVNIVKIWILIVSRTGRVPLHRDNAGLAGVYFILGDSLFNV